MGRTIPLLYLSEAVVNRPIHLRDFEQHLIRTEFGDPTASEFSEEQIQWLREWQDLERRKAEFGSFQLWMYRYFHPTIRKGIQLNFYLQMAFYNSLIQSMQLLFGR